MHLLAWDQSLSKPSLLLPCALCLNKEPKYEWERTGKHPSNVLCHLFLADPVTEQTTLFDGELHLPWSVQQGGGIVPESLSHWSASGEGRSLHHWSLKEEAEVVVVGGSG